MKKRMLALAVMSTVFSVGFVMSANAAENADQKLSQYSVDEVIVEGSRDLLPGGFVKSTSNVGIMGKKSIMETPFTKANLSEKAITAFETPGEGLTSALLNVPSVRSASSPMYNDFGSEAAVLPVTKCILMVYLACWLKPIFPLILLAALKLLPVL